MVIVNLGGVLMLIFALFKVIGSGVAGFLIMKLIGLISFSIFLALVAFGRFCKSFAFGSFKYYLVVHIISPSPL